MRNSKTIFKWVFVVVTVMVTFMWSGLLFCDVLTQGIDVDLESIGHVWWGKEFAIDSNYVWVANRSDNNVIRINKSDFSKSVIAVGTEPMGIVIDEQYVWVVNNGDDTVTRINKTDLSKFEINVGDSPDSIAVDSNYVWVTNQYGPSVTRIRKTDLSREDIPISGGYAKHIVVDNDYVWVTRGSGYQMARIRKSDLNVEILSIDINSDYYDMVDSGEYIWIVSDSSNKTLKRIKKSDLSTTVVNVSIDISCIAGSDNYIWVGASYDSKIVRINKSDLSTEEFPADINAGADYIAVDGDKIWVLHDFGDRVSRFTCRATCGKTTWYLAEGATLGDFDEWVLIMNPNNSPAECRVTFMKPDGSTVVRYVTVPETGRYTIYVNDIVPNESVSTMVESTNGVGVIAERAMYWDAWLIGDEDLIWLDWSDGHCSAGVTETATTWYLAEGATLGSFDEWVLIMNPNSTPANCRVTFMKPDGNTVVRYVTVPETGRFTIYVNDIVPNESVSTMVESIDGLGIIAERAMYWDGDGIEWIGGHCSAGVTETATTWYLAEGATLGSFDEWVLIMNPNDTPVNCRVTFMKPDGNTVVRYVTVPETGRYTIYVNDIVPNESVSTMVESVDGLGIIAERSMYWDSLGIEWAGGHCSVGVISPDITWYMAEGCTGGSFDEWVLIQNPNSVPAKCEVTFMKPDGSTSVSSVTVPATGRYTIHVNEEVFNESVSTMVESRNGVGIITERAMYWDSDVYCYHYTTEYLEYLGAAEWCGGHCSAGVNL